jgi:hypothetical protein
MFRGAPWIFSGLILLSGLVGAARETEDPWVHGIYTGGSPRPVAAAEPEAWRRAHNLAELTPAAFVLVGGGESMRPLYAPGTILVLQRRPYAMLERGQTALYRNRSGQVVAHVLIAKARDGWRVAGINNPVHDMEPVRPENLVGIVIAAYQPQSAGRVQYAALDR